MAQGGSIGPGSVVASAVVNALSPLYDSVFGEAEAPWEYRFGEPGYRENLGYNYPAAPPLDVTNPYTETYRSDILPRKPEDIPDVDYGRYGGVTNVTPGTGDFAVLEQELLALQDERQRQVDSNIPSSYMTGVNLLRVGDEGVPIGTLDADRIDFYGGSGLGGKPSRIEIQGATQTGTPFAPFDYPPIEAVATQQPVDVMSDRVKEALKQPYGSQGELQAITDAAIGAHVSAALRDTEKDGLNMYQRYMVGPEYSAPSTPTKDLRDITSQVDSFARMPETPITATGDLNSGGLSNSLVEAMSALLTPASLGKWTGTSPVMRIDPFNEGKGGSYYQLPVPYLDYPGTTADERLEEHETALALQKMIEANRRYDPAKEAAFTKAVLKPEEFGLDPFTNEQIREARATYLRLTGEESPTLGAEPVDFARLPRHLLQKDVAAHIESIESQVAKSLADAEKDQTLFTEDGVDVTSRAPLDFANIIRSINRNAPSTGVGADPGIEIITEPTAGPAISREQEIENMMREDREEQLKFHPSSPLYEAPLPDIPIPEVETFADIPVVQPGAEVPWTPPAPVVPDITQALADFSAIRDADEDRRNREQDERERELEQAADDRREAAQQKTIETARNKTARKKVIAKENKERKAEEKRISDSQAAAEKKRRATDKQMADMLKMMNETHQAYLDRKKKEEERRLRQGYGVGDMWT